MISLLKKTVKSLPPIKRLFAERDAMRQTMAQLESELQRYRKAEEESKLGPQKNSTYRPAPADCQIKLHAPVKEPYRVKQKLLL